MALVRFFSEIGIGDRLSVGGKGANLGEMTRAGLRVPPGFAVTADCFNTFMTALDGSFALRRSVERLDADDLAAIGETGARVRAEIEHAEVPSQIADAVAHAFAALCAGENLRVAVRSSATAEDSADASFAGLQDTYLWLSGAKAVAQHVRKCWASLYSAESISYRRRLGIGEDGLAMGVAVQRMVDARAAGVMFTRSPTTGDRSVIVIEGSYGLGSAIVSGEVTPDKFVVNKVTGDIADRTISEKVMQHVPAEDGVREEAVADSKRNQPCLSDDEVSELAGIGKDVERHYGRPQDIEWAVSRIPGEGIFLLQSRPETVWAKRDAEPVVKPAASALDHVFAVFGKSRAP